MSIASSTPMLLTPHSLVDPPPPGGTPRRVDEPPTNPTIMREIVACLDGSDLGRGILPHARLVANALGSHLTLLHVLEVENGAAAPSDPLDWEIRQHEARAQLDELVGGLGDVESGVASELIQGRPAEQICNWAERHDVDLTVLCSHGSKGLTDWYLASTARKLIDRTPGSLLLVPAAAARTEAARYRRILVPLDGSPRSESVLPIAMRIARSEGAELLLAYVVPVPEIIRTGAFDAEGEELQRRVSTYNRRIANDYLDRLRGRVDQTGTRVRARVVGGSSVRTKLERIVRDEGVDLVVMSAHSQLGGADVPCGSVTDYTVTHATVPVLVVRDAVRRRARRVDPSDAPRRDRLAATDHTPM